MKWRFADYEAELRAAKWLIIMVVCLCFAASAMVLLLVFYKKTPAPTMRYEQSVQRHTIATTQES